MSTLHTTIFSKILLITSFVVFVFFVQPVYAQNYVDEEIAAPVSRARQGTLNNEGYIYKQDNVYMTKKIEDLIGAVPGITAMDSNAEYNTAISQKSVIYKVDSYISYVFSNPPTNTVAFFRDVGQSFGFIPKQSYAQGMGFSGFQLILPLWKAFRNVAYVILSLFLVAIGFMIMFRKKIDPKTVVTVQNALPQVVIALILITFSYAIVSLSVDLMYVVMILILNILNSAGGAVLPQNTISGLTTGTFWQAFYMLFTGSFAAWNDIISILSPLSGIVGAAGLLTGVIPILLSSGGLTGVATAIPGAAIVALVPSLLLALILAIAIVIGAIRMLVMLINAYIQIIISLLTAPIQLLFSAFPGNHTFEQWFKNLIGELLTFPVTATLLYIGKFITTSEETSGQKLWSPPMIGGDGTRGMAGIIGLGLLFAIPTVVKSLKESLKAKALIQAGPSTILGPITAGVGQLATLGVQITQLAPFVHRVFPDKSKANGGHGTKP